MAFYFFYKIYQAWHLIIKIIIINRKNKDFSGSLTCRKKAFRYCWLWQPVSECLIGNFLTQESELSKTMHYSMSLNHLSLLFFENGITFTFLEPVGTFCIIATKLEASIFQSIENWQLKCLKCTTNEVHFWNMAAINYYKVFK